MEVRANSFLETEKIGVLMRRYAVPCVISLLVAALYNIVDQVFIANADYLGSCGNAANTTVFLLTVVALGIPFYMFGQAMNPIIRSDGSPKFAMAPAVAGAVVNIILDPIFIYSFRWGMMGAAASTGLSLVREIVFGVGLPILLPLAFGLSGVLYSFPVADVLTFASCVDVIAYTYRKLEGGNPAAANA